MRKYQELDAWKVCHQLTLEVHAVADGLRERDVELASEIWHAALITSSRIARGSAFPQRTHFCFWLNRSLGALIELEYYLNLADGLGLIEPETVRRLEDLRARANFYVTKLIFSLIEPPEPG